MSIFTVVFPAQAADAAMSGSVDALALSMLGFGVAGIVVTLLTVFKTKRARSKAASAKIAGA